MSRRSAAQIKEDALAIWHAGVDAVRSDRLVMENVHVEHDLLTVGDETFDVRSVERIAIIGGGKAGAGMAIGLEQALGDELLRTKQAVGWLNVPDDCVSQEPRFIRLHGARPAGVNEPTEAGVKGTSEMLRIARELRPNDLCFCLLSGGGSALMPAPKTPVTLADKQTITRQLSGAGANIQQLNTVRKQLSEIKGGGLQRVCGAGRLVTLIISDVIGDPLDVIASGPTAPDSSTPQQALDILREFNIAAPAGVATALSSTTRQATGDAATQTLNLIIGNNAVAVDAAGMEAERRGYSHAMDAATKLEGAAEQVGVKLAEMALRMRDEAGPDCLITGGEPIVQLCDETRRGLGGRNQQLVLAALQRINAMDPGDQPGTGIALLSGGTDGEDGPTDAAGASIDATLLQRARRLGLDAGDFLGRNDAYHYFEALDGLIKTGPTHTNVCDLRVVTVDRLETVSR